MNGNDEFQVGYGRASFSIKGRDALTIILMVVVTAALGFTTWLCFDTSRQMKGTNVELLTVLRELGIKDNESTKDRIAIYKALTDLAESNATLIYMLSLTEKDREKLKMTMPRSLRDILKNKGD